MSTIQPAPMVPTPEQCRAARAVLGWTLVQACQEISMGKTTLMHFEAGQEIRASSVERLRSLFETRGVTFDPDGRGVSW